MTINLLPDHLAELKSLSDPAIILDDMYHILATNTAYHDAFNLEADIMGEHCYRTSHGFDRPCDEAGENCPMKICIANQTPCNLLHIHKYPDGLEYVNVTVEPLLDKNGKILYFREIQRQTMIASAEPLAHGLVGVSHSFMAMLEQLHRVARFFVPVLLLGESGTGKELIARALHDASPYADKPFVPVECSGLSEQLFESELFGHRKGAFTGAQSDKQGLVETVDGGTLFLDEIGDVPLQLQVKLLRLLESQTFRKVGETIVQQARFRLVCATNRNIDKLMEKGEFRQDLYYRISAFPIHLPALRERREDIILLARSILLRIAPEYRFTLSEEGASLLNEHDFPGNIRELVNLLERARILADGIELLPEHFPELCKQILEKKTEESPISFPQDEEILPLKVIEQRYIRHVLGFFQESHTKLAALLGISGRTLTRKINEIKKI